jgi:hypothetical protein
MRYRGVSEPPSADKLVAAFESAILSLVRRFRHHPSPTPERTCTCGQLVIALIDAELDPPRSVFRLDLGNRWKDSQL